jgi:cell division protein FtsW
LLGATAFLVLGGLLMVYSASSVADYVNLGDSAYHLKKQLGVAAAGAVVLFCVSFWDFRSARTRGRGVSPEVVAWGLWALATIGLIAVEFAGVAKWGATRSIPIGPFYLQPSEFAKGGCLLVGAVLLVAWRRGALTDKELVKWLLGATAPVVFLIMNQPDMGTAATLVVALFLLAWLGGVRGRWLALTATGGGLLGALLIVFAGYRMARVQAFLDPWANPLKGGYQIIQSLYAFGSGGALGVGLGLSRQKYFYLPAAHTDFVFAVIGEELGIVGALSVVIAFLIFAYAGLRIAVECKDPFGRLMAGGLTSMIVVQALMNMAAVTGLMPITGIPLPLVSAGGSSLAFTLGCIGLILAVSRHSGGASVRLVRPMRTRGSQGAISSERRRNGGSYLPGTERGGTSARRRA